MEAKVTRIGPSMVKIDADGDVYAYELGLWIGGQEEFSESGEGGGWRRYITFKFRVAKREFSNPRLGEAAAQGARNNYGAQFVELFGPQATDIIVTTLGEAANGNVLTRSVAYEEFL